MTRHPYRPALGLLLALALAACDSAPPGWAPPEPAAVTGGAVAGGGTAHLRSIDPDRIPNGIYVLGNHPDGTQWRGGRYGLVVTGALGPQTAFDFEADGAEVLLTVNKNKIAVRGTALAYRKVGGTWTPDGFWLIDFQYKRNLSRASEDPAIEQGGWTDIRVGAPDDKNTGSLTDLTGGVSYPLSAMANDAGWTFQLGDEGGYMDDGHVGHRLEGHDLSGYDTDYHPGNSENGGSGGENDDDGEDAEPLPPVSGWGWVQVDGDEENRKPTDFLFIIKRRDGDVPQDG